MYRCQITNRLSKLGDKLNKVVVLTRPQTYTHWDREEEKEWTTTGSEIVLELNASAEGVSIWEGMTPEERDLFLKGMNR